jgi:hypothetical protein
LILYPLGLPHHTLLLGVWLLIAAIAAAIADVIDLGAVQLEAPIFTSSTIIGQLTASDHRTPVVARAVKIMQRVAHSPHDTRIWS